MDEDYGRKIYHLLIGVLVVAVLVAGYFLLSRTSDKQTGPTPADDQYGGENPVVFCQKLYNDLMDLGQDLGDSAYDNQTWQRLKIRYGQDCRDVYP